MMPRPWHALSLRAFRVVLVALMYVLAASTAVQRYMSAWSFRGDERRWGIERMIDGTAHRPFAFRVLSPLLIGGVSDLVESHVPPSYQQALMTESPVLRLHDRVAYEGWTYRKALHLHVAYLYVFVCLLGVAIAGRYLLRASDFEPSALTDFAPALGVLALPLQYVNGAYLYDASELLLLTLGTAFLLRRQWLFFCAALVLAILNKESNLLLMVSTLTICWPHLRERRVFTRIAVAGALALGTYFAVRAAMQYTPGASVWKLWKTNLRFWVNPKSYFLFFEGPAPLIPIPRGANVLNLLLFVVGAFGAWSVKPDWLKRTLLVLCVVNFPLLFLFGFHDELRNLSLLFPALFVSTCITVRESYRALANERATSTEAEMQGAAP